MLRKHKELREYDMHKACHHHKIKDHERGEKIDKKLKHIALKGMPY